MKTKKLLSLTQTALFIALMFLPMVSFAGPGFGGGVSDAGGAGGAPIDGGLSLLVAAGVGYGVKKLKDQKAKNQQKEK